MWRIVCLYVECSERLKWTEWLFGCPSEGFPSAARIEIINLVGKNCSHSTLFTVIHMSVRIKCCTDEQNFIEEKQLCVFSE